MERKKQYMKVIPFLQNSDYYFRRAMDAYEQGDLEQALSFFNQATTIEPDDVWIYFNTAIILEEMGRYREAIDVWSNQVLPQDAELEDAYFHLALSHAELGEMVAVRSNLLRYLELAPVGDLSLPARQILNAIDLELREEDLCHGLATSEIEVVSSLATQADSLMIQEQYLEAIENIEKILTLTGRKTLVLNKLALAYFRIGRTDMALQLTNEVLREEAKNIDALGNMLEHYGTTGNEVAAQSIIHRVREVPFISIRESIRWASSLGRANRHKEAYAFMRSRYTVNEYDGELLHMLAVASFHIGKYNEAREYWTELCTYDSKSVVAHLYLDIIEKEHLLSSLEEIIDYRYCLPIFSILKQTEKNMDRTDCLLRQRWKGNPAILFVCEWILGRQEVSLLRAGVELTGWLQSEESALILRKFLEGECADYRLKLYALTHYLVLCNTSCCDVRLGGRVLPLLKGKEKFDSPVQFEQVLDIIRVREFEIMPGLFNVYQRVWKTFCLSTLHDLPTIRKPSVWSAGLKYAIVCMFNLPLSLKAVAEEFDVSVSSVKRASRRIQSILLS